MKGLQLLSCGARNNKQRGGGVAIVVNTKTFTAKKLDIFIPRTLKVVWSIVWPKKVSQHSTFKEIIVAGFYSPPSKGKNSALIDHLTTTANSLLSRFPKADLIIGGDRNGMKTSPLIVSLPRTLQIDTKNTHNDEILDMILTNLHQYYAVPVILPPMKADNQLKHKSSDHKYAMAVPIYTATCKNTREYTTRKVRPTPETARREFGEWLLSETWSIVAHATNPTAKVAEMRYILNSVPLWY